MHKERNKEKELLGEMEGRRKPRRGREREEKEDGRQIARWKLNEENKSVKNREQVKEEYKNKEKGESITKRKGEQKVSKERR